MLYTDTTYFLFCTYIQHADGTTSAEQKPASPEDIVNGSFVQIWGTQTGDGWQTP